VLRFILSKGGPRSGKKQSMTSMNPFLQFGQASGLILSFAKAISFHENVVFLHKGCPRSSLALLRSMAFFSLARWKRKAFTSSESRSRIDFPKSRPTFATAREFLKMVLEEYPSMVTCSSNLAK